MRHEEERRIAEQRRKLRKSDGDILLIHKEDRKLKAVHSTRGKEQEAPPPNHHHQQHQHHHHSVILLSTPGAVGSKGTKRQWFEKQKNLPRSLDKLASEYRDRCNKPQEDEKKGQRAKAASENQVTLLDLSGILCRRGQAAKAVDDEQVEISRRRQASAGTLFANEMSFLAPEMKKRALDVEKKRVSLLRLPDRVLERGSS